MNLASLRQQLNSLKPRERLIIVAGSILVLVVGIYFFALAPLYRAVSVRAEHVQQKQADLAWLKNVAGEVVALSANQSAAPVASNESLVVLIDRTARECGLSSSLTGQTPNGETGIRVRLESAEFDKLIVCIASLQQRHAVSIESATIDRAGKPGLVNASLVLNRARG
ncbi:MAG TPA: type II secretion system protein M [Steroidobacteraceae bacterium]|jgi:type II secretory pathway component PulM|nr:type II secretion system protein M [Steroidobacteraceae bacterium]